jgi:hypothetical protein
MVFRDDARGFCLVAAEKVPGRMPATAAASMSNWKIIRVFHKAAFPSRRESEHLTM